MIDRCVSYRNPGRLFVDQCSPPDRGKDLAYYVDQYAHFLRETSGVGHALPVELDRICQHFGVNYANVSLPDIHDGASHGPSGLILIKQGGSETRRRFTKAHELMELLFSALKESRVSENVWHYLSGKPKEILCDNGAAALLIPSSFLQASLEDNDLSVSLVRSMARSLHISFLATIISAVKHHQGPYGVVAWKMMLKPSEQRILGSDLQPSLGPRFRS